MTDGKVSEKHLKRAMEIHIKSEFNKELIQNIAHALAKVEEETREEAAKIIDAQVKEHDEDNSCRESMWCECFGYHTLEKLAAAIRRKGGENGD